MSHEPPSSALQPQGGELPRDRRIATFGRQGSRNLSPHQRELMRTMLPELRVPMPDSGMVDLGLVFPHSTGEPGTSEFWLEIGFGSGEHMIGQAKANPQLGYLGCEVFREGVGRALSKIEQDALTNIRLWDDDARDLLERLPDACLDRAFILFPDPWPKPRHHKRRIVSMETLDLLARVMKPGAVLRCVTDIDHYAAWMVEHFLRHPDFDWLASSPDDWRNTPDDWVPTRYQAKATREGRPSYYLDAQRISA